MISARPGPSSAAPGRSSARPGRSSAAPGRSSAAPGTEFGNSRTEFGGSWTEFGSSRTEFGNSRTEFGGSWTEFSSSRTEFGGSRTGFGNSRTEFSSSRTPFGAAVLVNRRGAAAYYLDVSVSVLFLAVAAALPQPTGLFPIGRVTLELVDRSRSEPPSPDRAPRTLMVDIWYPADASNAPAAPYLDVAAFERAIGAAGLRRQLGGAYDAIKDGRARTHAVERAPFARSVTRAPVLIFSPGGGLVREIYAAQLEDLASHGFVVAALTHPYDGIVSVYSDGHTITYDAKRWPQIPSFLGEWNLNQLEWHARDIRFVLDELERMNGAGASRPPFAGHIDVSRVGVFGHSFGGVAAAKACQTDRRITACLNEDGLAGRQPFDVDGGSWASSQRYMLIVRAAPAGPPPDEDLVQMKMNREQAEALVARLDREHETALRLPGGSFEVVLDPTKTTHMDFTDLPLLGATTEADTEARGRVVETVRALTFAFFDSTLRGKRASVLENTSPIPPVQTIRRFGRVP